MSVFNPINLFRYGTSRQANCIRPEKNKNERMKLNKIKICAMAGIVILFAGACKKSFFTDVNKNPNTVDNVNPNLLLPSCEIALAFTQDGDLSRYSSLL